ncbi:MAG: bi-domain-containing oxidoreductase [Bacteroidetes bacterium]|nr:bi-domain-containing oxidoreductase [Bacteroidota bacterium]MBU2585109.1 bi-domain-containing oxidoreductase [Bacteroidota bacterium]
MKQLLQRIKDGEMVVADLPSPALLKKGVLVQNHFSLISAGTERISVEKGKDNLLLKAYKNPDLVKSVLQIVKRDGLVQTAERVFSSLNDFRALGYSSAGVVFESSSEKFKPGDRVACAGAGLANHAEVVFIPENLCVKIPENVSIEEAAFTTLGAIALQGVRQADVTLGETIAVVGLGLLGLITVQLLQANGCKVIGLDISDDALKFAKDFGADFVLKSSKSSKEEVIALTNGYGVDKVILTAGTESNEPIELAGEICREKGKVVIVGAVKVDMPRGPYYMKELEIIMSRSYGPGRYDVSYEEEGRDYPFGYVRWTENRNMQAFLDLISAKKIDIKPLLTHKFKIENFQTAYDLILGKSKEFYRGILFEYETLKPEGKKYFTTNISSKKSDDISIGFIGAGSFASANLLPHLKKMNVQLHTVCTIEGVQAKSAAHKFGFQNFTTEPLEVLDNKNINTVFIVTRHDTHASFVLEALRRGKQVFVEKPLAINESELNEIMQLNSDAKYLLVGFNRRFAPGIVDIKNFFNSSPFNFLYRVNAGKIPLTHWAQRPDQGGRIIGEVCHFVDTLSFICDSLPKNVFASSISMNIGNDKEEDTLSAIIKFNDGSIGTIIYQANGDNSVSKEYLEVSSGQKSAILHNFEKVDFYQAGKKFTKNYSGKGHKEEVTSFINSIKKGEQSPITLESIFYTTKTTFAIIESLRTNKLIEISI